jgi:hypothetical protein
MATYEPLRDNPDAPRCWSDFDEGLRDHDGVAPPRRRGRSPVKIGLCVLLCAMAASGAARRDEIASAVPQPESPATAAGCAARAANHRLDFWLGDWTVYVGGTVDGTNHIASILGGCIVQEEWIDVAGHQGRGWFFVDPVTQRLKQVWLTSRADEFGGTKEKLELPGSSPRSVRFQGVLTSMSGERVFDRTTLTREVDDTVRQVIEMSRDDGHTWKVQYDAIYRRAPPNHFSHAPAYLIRHLPRGNDAPVIIAAKNL